MHIILGKTVFMDGARRTPVARHVAPGCLWQDTISGDAASVLTIIPGELTEEEVAAIDGDDDVVNHIFLEGDASSPLSPEMVAYAEVLASRYGFPDDALPAIPTGNDLIEAVKSRVLYSQVIHNVDLASADHVADVLQERLIGADFPIDEIGRADSEETIRKKVLKNRGPV